MPPPETRPDDRPPPATGAGTDPSRPPPVDPDTVAEQLDHATEASLSAVPAAPGWGLPAARRALEQAVARHLAGLGMHDLARRYLARRRRRARHTDPATSPTYRMGPTR